MSTNPLNDLSKVYLDRVATLNTDLEDKSVKRWEDMGGPTPGNYKADNNSAKLSQESRKVRVQNSEQFSNWRSEGFFEAITTPTTDSKALRKVSEKSGINNKVEINPKLREAVAEMGGELLGVKEETDAQLKKQEKQVYDDEKKDAQADQVAAKEKRAAMIKRQVLLKKMQAVRQGAGDTIMASHQPKGKMVDEGKYKSPEQSGIVTPEERERRRKKNTKIWEEGGKKVEEEVGISSASAMEKARKEAALRKKEEDAVKKAKKVNEAKVDTGSAEAKASARNKRNTPPGKDYKFDTSVFITRKPGESLDSARTRKRREAHAAKRGVKEDQDKGYVVTAADKKGNTKAWQGYKAGVKSKTTGKPLYRAADHLKEADKAFDNVVAALRKKYGESGVLTKDSPKPKAQPQPKAKPQKPLTDKEKAHREVIARYGGEANYKAGRGLGT